MGKHRSDKRSRNVVSSDEEDGPSSSKNQKTDHAREDEFGNLFDEEERERLNQMSEKDREIAIYKRMEMNQMLKTRLFYKLVLLININDNAYFWLLF